MRRILDPTTVLMVAVLLAMAIPALADGLQMTGPLPQKPPGQASWTDQIKSGFGKLTRAILPEEERPEKTDELSLSRAAKPSPELHVALAESYTQNGQIQKATIEYEKALKLDSKHEDTLLRYARFCDRINQPAKAETLYRKATQTYPRVARVFNHHGLFLVRHKRYDEAAEAFSTAVALEPIEESYRGNLAVVLVDLGRHSDAYKQLRAVQSPDTAYYNLGYLLQERGKTDLAIKHFQVALSKNPHHKEAGIWLAHLRQQQAESAEMQAVAANEMVASQPVPQVVQPRQVAAMPGQVVVPPQAPAMSLPPVPPKPNPPRMMTRPLPEVGNAPLPPAMTLPPPLQSAVRVPSPKWQPQVPPIATDPVRMQPSYRTTVPPAHQQPYVPAPAEVSQNLLPPIMTPVPSGVPESPSLVAPSGNMAPAQRLPFHSVRRTVNSSSDRYITPLPPVDWSDTCRE